MNLERIGNYLSKADGVSDWILTSREADALTVIRLPGIYTAESGRFISQDNAYPREVISSPSETVEVTIYSAFEADGADWLGDASGQFTSDDEKTVKAVVDNLVSACRGQRNRPFPLPGKDERYPEMELADPQLSGLDHTALLDRAQEFNNRIVAACADKPGVAVSNLETFIHRTSLRVLTSAGRELRHPTTRIDVEICFLGRPAEDKVGEHTARLSCRRLSDLNPEAIVAEYASAARDIALASPPPHWQGPVVLTGEAAADFLSLQNTPLVFHANARMVYEKTGRYEKGKPVWGDKPLVGEPLNLTSDPLVPFGLRSSCLSETDATPCRPVTIVKDGCYDGLLGARRYYYYLGLLDRNVPAPGNLGESVIPAGTRTEAELTSPDCVVVKAFSSFSVDRASGQFAVEIRLGKLSGRPFKGGLLVGNWFDSLADVSFSRETQAYQSYRGPYAIRFGNLKVAG